jgi:valyl-tRNA synthetase
VFRGEEADDANNEHWVCGEDEVDARAKAEKKFPGKSFTLRWDEDVLDT